MTSCAWPRSARVRTRAIRVRPIRRLISTCGGLSTAKPTSIGTKARSTPLLPAAAVPADLRLAPGSNPVMKGARFNHIGIPTAGRFEGEIDLPHLKVTVSDHQDNPFGIQWQRYWEDSLCPDLVKTVPHVAFEVDDLTVAIADYPVLIEPNSPSPGVIVAF